MTKGKTPILEIILPMGIVAVFSVLSLAGVMRGLERRVYDFLLHLRPAIAEDRRLAIIAIDDESLDLGGTFPWPRNITAEGLLRLKEVGLDSLTFDIEFLNPSPFGINETVLNEELPSQIRGQVREYKDTIDLVLDQVTSGAIKLDEAREYLPELGTMGDELGESIVRQVGTLVQDNDRILANSYRVFGKAYGTLNTKIEGSLDDPAFQATVAWALEHGALDGVEILPGPPIPRLDRITPPILAVNQAAKAMGYTNMEPDADGVTRRVQPLGVYEGKVFATLSMAAILDMLGNPPIKANGRRIIIARSALDPQAKDIVIPLDAEGNMLINWTKKPYETSFNNQIVSFGQLIRMQWAEEAMASALKALQDNQVFTNYDDPFIYSTWQRLKEVRADSLATGDPELFEAYLEAKEAYMAEVLALTMGSFATDYLSLVDGAIEASSGETKEGYMQYRDYTALEFDNLKQAMTAYDQTRSELINRLEGRHAIMGQTGAATTDLGVTPFESTFNNVAVHLNVANTILQGNFLREVPSWITVLGSVLMLGIIILVSRTMKPLPAALGSFAFLAAVVTAFVLVFVFTGVYTDIASPGLAILTSSVGLTLLKFRSSEKEKGFIRGAFARYLSDDVIKQIVQNPDALNLGGDKKVMTAIFTDVKGFSTISEKLDPTDLVKLLNEYLSAMSDLVLDSGGFIDKYEGDAIIAFWGAPLPYEDHARRSCLTALKMRRIEGELNKGFLERKMTPTPLLTRIGINTGEMVVGNMGTERRLNYTIMGNAVNLAARLEGVNKQYGTWILTSEYTRDAAGDDFLYRSLDRVRVVGINTPVRLYEVVDEKSAASNTVLETVAIFEEAITKFEARDFAGSRKLLAEALKLNPEDGPSKVFAERCDTYMKTPPKEGWDGVFNLTSK